MRCFDTHYISPFSQFDVFFVILFVCSYSYSDSFGFRNSFIYYHIVSNVNDICVFILCAVCVYRRTFVIRLHSKRWFWKFTSFYKDIWSSFLMVFYAAHSHILTRSLCCAAGCCATVIFFASASYRMYHTYLCTAHSIIIFIFVTKYLLNT